MNNSQEHSANGGRRAGGAWCLFGVLFPAGVRYWFCLWLRGVWLCPASRRTAARLISGLCRFAAAGWEAATSSVGLRGQAHCCRIAQWLERLVFPAIQGGLLLAGSL